MPNPEILFQYLKAGYLLEATNSFFEFCIWLNVCVRLYGWPMPQLGWFVDVAAKSGAWTLPRSLDGASTVLKTPVRKDQDGAKIMKLVSKPHTPTIKEPFEKYTRENSPDKFEKLDAYCGEDVKAEDAVSLRCPDLS
ncbi:MAG: hypothetical protein IIC93_03400, partial [Chloroflexi bacterium]|nr:hypothetical protein [Chloroflexota bacterium]